MDADVFDALMASVDPAMVVVTTAFEGERSGCLVGFAGQSSIEPRHYAVWASKVNHTYRVALQATHLAVHFLADTDADHELARIFGELTGDTADKFALVPTSAGPGGVPVIESCEHGLVGVKVSMADDGGDHVSMVLEPIDVWTSGPFTPLRLSAVSDIHPAHPAA